jgi:hypothetical protein
VGGGKNQVAKENHSDLTIEKIIDIGLGVDLATVEHASSEHHHTHTPASNRRKNPAASRQSARPPRLRTTRNESKRGNKKEEIVWYEIRKSPTFFLRKAVKISLMLDPDCCEFGGND